MSSQVIQVEIPVLPHVKKLLLSIYGKEPIKASEANLPGKELRFLFMSKTKDQSSQKIVGETITIYITDRLAPYYHKFKNAFSLGCYFEKQFHVLLFMHVEAQKKCGVSTFDAIRSFYKSYDIDVEFFSLQNALTIYRRIKSNQHLKS